MAYDFDLFVIGGGSAGTRLGRISAGHGARVGVAEERFWGGTCVNVGCVPKKLMVIAAEYGFGVEDARGFGWETHLGDHDWQGFIAAKNREISRLNGIYRKLLDNAGATVVETRAELEDAHTIRVGDQRVTAERIAIATGGRPTPLDIPGADLAIVSDDAFHLPDRPGHVAIVGSGYIAVEFAGIFAGLGSTVDLVYRADLPLRGFDDDLRQESEAALSANGIKLHPGSRPVSIEARGDRRLLTLDDGTTIETDHVFFATGRAPNVEGLGLAQAGIATAENGAIHVDDGLATSVPHIFALGDVTDRVNLTPVATAQGHALADTLFGGKPRRISLQNVPSAVFTIPPLATVGLTETDAASHGEARIFISRFSPMRHTLSGRQRRTMMKLVVDVASDRVLGAHMFGEESPEIIQGLAVAIQAGATKADFDRTIGIHPTSAEEFVTLRQESRRAGGRSAAEAAE